MNGCSRAVKDAASRADLFIDGSDPPVVPNPLLLFYVGSHLGHGSVTYKHTSGFLGLRSIGSVAYVGNGFNDL